MHLLIPLVACAPDPWTDARATCGFDDGATLDWGVQDRQEGGWNALEVDGACAEHLVRDLHADPAEVLALFDGGEDLGVYVADARTAEEPVDGLPVTIWGLYWLVGGDFGTVGALEAGPYVDPKWVEVIGRGAGERGLDGDAPLAQVLYDLVATRIRGIALFPGDSGGASAGVGSGDSLLYLPRTFDPDFAYAEDPYAASVSAYTLAHESEHAVDPIVPHVRCGSYPDPACDTDLTGAQGFEIAMRWAQIVALVGDASCIDDDDPDHLRAWDLEYDIQGRWQEFVLLAPPEPQLVACR